MKKIMWIAMVVLSLGLWSHSWAWPIIWDGGNNEQCYGVATDSSGNVIAVGFYHPSDNNIWRVAKYNSSGTLL